MDSHSSDGLTDQLVKPDEGRINAKIIAKEPKKDYLANVESARRKIPISLSSPEMKRVFLRFFDTLQLHAYVVSVVARTKVQSELVERVEANIHGRIENLIGEVNKAIDGAEQLFKHHGITTVAEYDAQPLALVVRVISSFGRRYLELISKVDQLMPMLETLAIDDVITQRELDLQKARFKGEVKGVARFSRILAIGMRRRMNEIDAQGAEKPASQTPIAAQAQDLASSAVHCAPAHCAPDAPTPVIAEMPGEDEHTESGAADSAIQPARNAVSPAEGAVRA